jgi:hypothetical protein
MKGSLNSLTFMERCVYIDNLIQGGACPYLTHIFKERKGTSFSAYTERASRKGLLFELTEEEFAEIRSAACYVCQRVNIPGFNQNGIDRVDNKLGYVTTNVRACCDKCNYMKKELEIGQFRSKVKEVAAKAIENIDKKVLDSERYIAHK